MALSGNGSDTIARPHAAQVGLDPARIPVHIAIIMDGNGRWARAQGEDRLYGHHQGYRTLKQIVYAADELGVRYLTVYGFSSENWRRPEDEVDGLMELMRDAMRAELEVIQARAQLQNSRINLEDVLHAPLSGPELALADTMPSIVAGAAGSPSEAPR